VSSKVTGGVNRESVKSSLEGNTVEKYTGVLQRDDQVPKKPIASMSFGERVRIARLFLSYEEFVGKIIRVAGWAKSTRAQSKDFCFIELNDGSCFKNIQVIVDKAVAGFEEVAKANVGASFIF
jgi:hypothetical protein